MAVLGMMGMVLVFGSRARAATPSVYLDPGKSIDAGSSFVATMRATDVEIFDAAQFDLIYDPRLMEVDSVSAGKLGSHLVEVVIWNEVAPGVVRVVVNVPGTEGVDGNGYLAVVRFNTSSVGGVSSVGLSNGFMSAYDCTEIVSNWSGAEVTVKVKGDDKGFDNSKWLTLEIIAVIILLFGVGMLVYWIFDNYEVGFGEEGANGGD